jgi:hypothetical protein
MIGMTWSCMLHTGIFTVSNNCPNVIKVKEQIVIHKDITHNVSLYKAINDFYLLFIYCVTIEIVHNSTCKIIMLYCKFITIPIS